MLVPWKKSYDQSRQYIKKQRHYFANKSPSTQGYGFFSSHVWMWEFNCKEKLSAEELMLLNCAVGEDSWESLGLQGDPTSTSWRKSVLNINWKDWCWSWNCNTLATWCKGSTHWKRPWCWEGLKAGEGDDRGWDGCMASLIQQTWVWVNSRSWWWTGRPGMLQSVSESDRTEQLNWTLHMHRGKCVSKCDQVKQRLFPWFCVVEQSNKAEVQAHGEGRGLGGESVVTQQTVYCSRSQITHLWEQSAVRAQTHSDLGNSNHSSCIISKIKITLESEG